MHALSSIELDQTPLAHIPLALAALLLEAAIGYPNFLYRAIGHPVTWIGALITVLDARLNRAAASDRQRRMLGIVAVAVLLAVAWCAAMLAGRVLSMGLIGGAMMALISTSLLAQRSLHDHVRAVADALEQGGLEAGRTAVAMIVGRNPARLDEAGVARAAIESLAENFSDGVVAPAFWLAAGGLPTGLGYKAINTADSMIGHLTPRYAAFGWAAARLDDLVNLPASRLSALFLVLGAWAAGASPRGAIIAVRDDASRHRSPNAGWPEAAMAGALGLRLSGPRIYGETLVDDAFMGNGRREASAADIHRALGVYRAACASQAVLLLVLTLTWPG